MGVSLGEGLELVRQLGLEGDRPLEPSVEDRNDPTHGPLAPGDLTLARELLALEPPELHARGGLLRDPLECATPPLLRHLGRLAGTLGYRTLSELRSFWLSASTVRSSDIAVSSPLVLRSASFRADGS
jgi:hypothetical protein